MQGGGGGGGGGGTESRSFELSGASRKQGGEYERGVVPPLTGGVGGQGHVPLRPPPWVRH